MSDSSVVKLSRFQADLSRSLARRGQRMLEMSDLQSTVEKLAPLEAYLIVKELGVEDAQAIVKATSQEQFQAFIDLDCWRDGAIEIVDIDAWLSPFAAGTAVDLATAFMKLDEELQILFLSRIMVIYDAKEANDVPDAPKSVVRKFTPDGYFLIEPIPHADREIDPLYLLEGLYTLDLNRAFSMVTSARWEMQSPMEEQAFQFRSARLEGLGFPTLAEALKLFAPPPKNPTPPLTGAAPEVSTLPALYAEPLKHESLLARALARISEPALLTTIEETLVNLINAATVAYDESPGSIRKSADVARRVRDTVSLGLETLMGDTKEFPQGEAASAEAAALLGQWTLFDLFRHGHRATRELQRAAQEMSTAPQFQEWLATPESEEEDYGQDRLDRELCKALLERAPQLAGFEPTEPTKKRAFATHKDIEYASERLDALAERMKTSAAS